MTMRPPSLRRLLTRRLITASTARYAAAGWPVAPGAWWDGHRYTCPAPACRTTGLHPAGDPTHGHPTGLRTGTAHLDAWVGWATHPHTILLPTGDAFDVFEAPAAQAGRAWRRLYATGVLVPAASLPSGRWLLFTAPAPDLPAHDLPAHGLPRSVVHHGTGSYVPAPPSTLHHGAVRWEHAPWVTGWVLPEPRGVLGALTRQLRARSLVAAPARRT